MTEEDVDIVSFSLAIDWYFPRLSSNHPRRPVALFVYKSCLGTDISLSRERFCCVLFVLCVIKRFFYFYLTLSTRMAITREKKKQLVEQYAAGLKVATNAVVLQQNGITVGNATKVRKTVKAADGSYTVVRKRLFMRAAKEAGLPEVVINDLPGSIVLITANGDNEFGPIKAVNAVLKELKKEDK